MLDILSRAGCFVAIIVLGFVLRRIGFFNEHAFPMLSKIVIRITLPASVVVGFSQKQLEPSLLSLAAMGIAVGGLLMLLGYLANCRRGKQAGAFGLLNTTGYNIGCFAMPFVQSFLAPIGIVATSIFDTSNAMICLGGAFGVAASVQEGHGLNLRRIGKALIRSVPFLTYVTMLILSMAKIRLPSPVLSLAETISGGNAFLAMLMIGVGIRLEADRTKIGQILKVLAIRNGVAAVLSLAVWFLLPFELAVKQALVILLFSPIASAAPAYTGELNNDVGLASTINSASILCSIVIILVLLLVML